MKLIRNVYNLPTEHREYAVTIGNFDGVHLGHRVLLEQLTTRAKQLGLPALVICFEPQPQEYFSLENPPARLTQLREKISQLAQCGIDYVLCLPFNQALADISPEDFVQNILISHLKMQYLIVGKDFRFGHQRTGNIEFLQTAGQQHQFEVTVGQDVMYANERISSTRIRTALTNGHMDMAQQLLDRPYSMQGHVVKGDQRGRLIGFPTANIYLGHKRLPIAGVFAVKVRGIFADAIPGVANIGSRPTVDGSRTVLEVHLFDFEGSLYHRTIQVDFIHKIRDEKRFDSLEQLTAQIAQDAIQARILLDTALPLLL
jgi:riboflavin kinase/FMN adenylyltransferase